MLLEIACFNLASARVAVSAGADRIEFCRNYSDGGITPALEDIFDLRFDHAKIPIHVIIRPRPGNFVYDNRELRQMKRDVSYCRKKNIDGVVFGILKSNGSINEEACKELLKEAKPMHCTFHRAIDECTDIFSSVETLVKLGFHSVLTSGGKGNAIDNIATLEALQSKYGSKINIIAAGGIRSGNIKELITKTECLAYHSAAITGKDEVANEEEIRKMKKILRGF